MFKYALAESFPFQGVQVMFESLLGVGVGLLKKKNGTIPLQTTYSQPSNYYYLPMLDKVSNQLHCPAMYPPFLPVLVRLRKGLLQIVG